MAREDFGVESQPICLDTERAEAEVGQANLELIASGDQQALIIKVTVVYPTIIEDLDCFKNLNHYCPDLPFLKQGLPRHQILCECASLLRVGHH